MANQIPLIATGSVVRCFGCREPIDECVCPQEPTIVRSRGRLVESYPDATTVDKGEAMSLWRLWIEELDDAGPLLCEHEEKYEHLVRVVVARYLNDRIDSYEFVEKMDRIQMKPANSEPDQDPL